MRLNKFRRVEPAAGVFAVTWPDERRDEFAHFEMKMREVAAVRGANSRDLLATLHRFAWMHKHVLNVSVVRLHVFAFAVFQIRVQQNDDVAPTGAAITREQDTKTRGATAD